MKKFFVGLLALIIAIIFNATANADWKFESDNKPSGLTAFASSYWINGIGSVNYYGLQNSNLEYETYYVYQEKVHNFNVTDANRICTREYEFG